MKDEVLVDHLGSDVLTHAATGEVQGDLFTELERSLPPAIARKDVPQFFHGVISSGWLANLDCAGRGPKSFKCGKIVVYTRGALIEWLRAMNEGGAV